MIGDQHQFPIATQQEVGPIGGLVDGHFPWLVGSVHDLDHRCGNTECAGKHRSCEDQHGNDEANHAGATAELGQFTAPEHGPTGNSDTDEADRISNRAGQAM